MGLMGLGVRTRELGGMEHKQAGCEGRPLCLPLSPPGGTISQGVTSEHPGDHRTFSQ